ncbi:MAG: FAD-dependent oxidoreductase [Planctomycetota bacterium]
MLKLINLEVVVVGGGFGELAPQHLARVPVHVTLLDRRNFHLFQPLLYQVATGGISPAGIAALSGQCSSIRRIAEGHSSRTWSILTFVIGE